MSKGLTMANIIELIAIGYGAIISMQISMSEGLGTSPNTSGDEPKVATTTSSTALYYL